ncbi:MAG TPA: response regulator [Candidatus Limnocylindria bacterium]|nr:response regulator [Candidatus Limnocylindria bacterium]
MSSTPQPIDILLVEDSTTDALLVEDVLTQERQITARVVTVNRLQAALAHLASQKFDIVLTDLGLPDSSGIATLRSLHGARPGVPIIVLTSLSDDQTGIAAVQAGAQDYLTKDLVRPQFLGRSILHAIERSHLQSQLQRSQQMLAVGQLAGGIAHEFNNLLTVFFANVDMLQTGADQSPDTQTAAREIGLAAQRAATLTRQLLAFSRRQSMVSRQLDLSTIVGDMHRTLGGMLGDSVQIDLHLSLNLPLFLGDVGMIEQVIVNLAMNARDAMAGGGRLTIATDAATFDEATARRYPEAYAGDFVKLTVADVGCGIPSADMAQLFEPFFTTKEVGKGTGLGLATVYGIVREHLGWLRVDSEVGKGSQFEVFLPVCRATLEVENPDGASAPGLPELGSLFVLMVEEDVQLRTMMTTILRKQGYRVLEAATGLEALGLWTRNRDQIALVIMDTVVAGVSTRELAQTFANERPGIHLLFATSYSQDSEFAMNGLASGRNLIAKPYRPADLLNAISRLLR